jgi:hypothetical protein
VLLLAAAAPVLASEGLSLRGALHSISAAELKEHLTFLAADELNGRDAGSPGCRKAAEYLRRELVRDGLRPLGDHVETGTGRSFFQSLTVTGTAVLAEEGNAFSVTSGGKTLDYRPGRDYLPLALSANAAVTNRPVAFVGYGITDEESGYDDYAGIDAKGKVVVMFRYEHAESTARVYQPSRHAWLVTKVENAMEHGAVGVVIVNGPNNRSAGDDDPLIGLGNVGRLRNQTVPVVHAKQAVLARLLEDETKDLAAFQKRLDRTRLPASVVIWGKTVSVSVRLRTPEKRTQNVVALVEGSDPKLRQEYVVVGAHYDHIGLGAYGSRSPKGRGKVHNGADDNGSGTVAVLEAAEAAATLRPAPKRSLLFVLFTGEERGLIGSRHFVENPPVPRTSIVAMLNADMVGRSRGGRVHISGVGTCPAFPPIVEHANGGVGLKVSTSESGWSPSDNVAFVAKDIPVLFYHTGLHKQYHTPADDVARINFADHERIARHLFRVAVALANYERKIEYVAVKRRGAVKLGIALDIERFPAVVVRHVLANTPAQRAGLMPGDEILELAGVAIDAVPKLRRVLAKQTRGKKAALKVRRPDSEGEPKIVELRVPF